MQDMSQGPFFRRFLAEDRDTTLREIAADRTRLAEARRSGDLPAEMVISIGIGFGLYVTANEVEAVPMLDSALVLARQLGDQQAEIETLLHLATARQYLGERRLAQELFQEALDRSETYGIAEFTHFILHHRGRCYVEQGMLDDARRAFEQALALRELLGNPRFIQSSRAALAQLTAG